MCQDQSQPRRARRGAARRLGILGADPVLMSLLARRCWVASPGWWPWRAVRLFAGWMHELGSIPQSGRAVTVPQSE